MYPNCNHPKFANQICNVSPMRSIGWTHAGYILNVPHFSNVIALCPMLSRREVSARQDAMTYLVWVRELLSGW